MKAFRPFAVVLASWCALAAGQSKVYESQDKAGPVYSDQPTPGARELVLPPPNVISAEPPAPQPPAAAGEAAPLYRSLAVSSPADGDTLHSNTGAFELGVQVVPALREGDRIRVKLDGILLPERYTSTRIQVTEADWQTAARDDVEHTLQLAVVDEAGAVLIESGVTSFYLHRATVFRRLPR